MWSVLMVVYTQPIHVTFKFELIESFGYFAFVRTVAVIVRNAEDDTIKLHLGRRNFATHADCGSDTGPAPRPLDGSTLAYSNAQQESFELRAETYGMRLINF